MNVTSKRTKGNFKKKKIIIIWQLQVLVAVSKIF